MRAGRRRTLAAATLALGCGAIGPGVEEADATGTGSTTEVGTTEGSTGVASDDSSEVRYDVAQGEAPISCPFEAAGTELTATTPYAFSADVAWLGATICAEFATLMFTSASVEEYDALGYPIPRLRVEIYGRWDDPVGEHEAEGTLVLENGTLESTGTVTLTAHELGEGEIITSLSGTVALDSFGFDLEGSFVALPCPDFGRVPPCE